MKNLYLHQHLGLGDQIICNGLTRILSKNYDTVYLYVYNHNLESIRFMYRDLEKIKFIKVYTSQNWNEIIQYVDSYKSIYPNSDHLRLGHEYLNNISLAFDKAFYAQCNISFEERCKSFYVQRDLIREKELFNNLHIEEGKYIIVNKNTSGGAFDIDVQKHTKFKNYPVINVDKLSKNEIIFDWIYTCLNAAEIFSIDGGFKAMIDSFTLTQSLYFKPRTSNSVYASSCNNWQLII
jgi:hypothetical protein